MVADHHYPDSWLAKYITPLLLLGNVGLGEFTSLSPSHPIYFVKTNRNGWVP